MLLACVAMSMSIGAQAKTLNVSLILSETGAPYQQFANTFKEALAARNVDVNIVVSDVVSKARSDLIVTVGLKSAELAISQSDIPVLVTMVPESGYRGLTNNVAARNDGQLVSAIFLDQPLSRQIDFIKAALPKLGRIGVLYSSGQGADLEMVRKVVARQDLVLVAQQVSDDGLFPALDKVLADSDVLLVMPDTSIYNSSNIRNILLTSYRRSVPLIGISMPYVKAGALCAIFSTPEQLAVQAAEAVSSYLRTKRLPSPQYPENFMIEINRQVERSLEIELPMQDAIRVRMESMGREVR